MTNNNAFTRIPSQSASCTGPTSLPRLHSNELSRKIHGMTPGGLQSAPAGRDFLIGNVCARRFSEGCTRPGRAPNAGSRRIRKREAEDCPCDRSRKCCRTFLQSVKGRKVLCRPLPFCRRSEIPQQERGCFRHNPLWMKQPIFLQCAQTSAVSPHKDPGSKVSHSLSVRQQ